MPEPSTIVIVVGDGWKVRRPGGSQWSDRQQAALVAAARRLGARVSAIQKQDPKRKTEAGQLASEADDFLRRLTQFVSVRGWEQ